MDPLKPKIILLIEDNPDDEALTLRAFKKNNIMNEVIVARDGQQAIDYFFGENSSENPVPAVVLLDLKLPKIEGLEVLRRDPSRCTNELDADSHPHFLKGRAGCHQWLQPRRQQLHPQTGGLQPVHGGDPAARSLLAGAE